MVSEPGAPQTSHEGVTPNATRYQITVPPAWNGDLLLYCRGLPAAPSEPPWQPHDPLFAALSDSGYAIAGSGGTSFWPLEHAFENQAAVLDAFCRLVAEPRRTFAWGYSIGGIIAAGLLQRIPSRLSGALPLCGNLAGAVAIHNRELDMAFVIRTLLDRGGDLQIARIEDPAANLGRARAVLARAQSDAAGRARLALAAAIGNIPGWFDPAGDEPFEDDIESRQRNQFRWYEDPVFMVMFMLRSQVERQSGGNPSWNTDVVYEELLGGSINRHLVEALYQVAGVELADDLAVLAATPRIAADPDAVAYLEQNIIFSGELYGVPVLTLHTTGDGLVTPDNEHAYADVVAWAGQDKLLRQLYVRRGGHCSFTIGEVLTGLNRLAERVEQGIWPCLDPAELNQSCAKLGLNSLIRDGYSASPSFVRFQSSEFPRPYDVRKGRELERPAR